MKQFVLVCLLLVSAQAHASDDLRVTLGKLVSYSNESTFQVRHAGLSIAAVTAGKGLPLKGCYESVTDSGDVFPFNKDYNAYGDSLFKEVTAEVKDEKNIINLGSTSELTAGIAAMTKSLKKKVPFYCKVELSMSIMLEVVPTGADYVVRSVLMLEKDSKGFFIREYGYMDKIYLPNGRALDIANFHLPVGPSWPWPEQETTTQE